MVFEKTLTDIVKGIRASKRDTPLYISSCIAEIKSEINSTDLHTKANALQKLTFLQMMGYNMSWASFATIEVMSSPRFAHKRVGYLAASQAFTQDTDVILLTTNSLKKELRGAIDPGMNGVYEAGLAIDCLSNIVTEDLARELLSDITNLTVHPQPYLRKKAILCLLKMFMKYPQGLRLTFPRIQECLMKDGNASVTSCAVNVITELSDKNPRNYLVLAPSFFALLTSSSNNWMLIKVVKLLGSLVPEEPRLARKLLEPLAGIVKNTQAKSLLYEAIYTITLCLPYCQKSDGTMPASVPSIVALCAENLRSFVEESDQNLKYLGLAGFGSLMTSHPKVLSAPGYRPLILACLSDEDITIRTRALDLLIGLATRKNIMDLITQLLHHVDMATGNYKVDLVERIIEICSSEKYALVTDFAWYMDVLVILARTKGIDGHAGGTNLGPLVSSQIIDVTLRVLPVRPYAVRRMIGIILEGGKNENENVTFSSTFGLESNVNMLPEVLPNAAFIIGEYSSLIDEAISMEVEGSDDEDELRKYNSSSIGTYHAILQALTDPSIVDSLSLRTQSIYIHATMKVFAACATSSSCSNSELEACAQTLSKYLHVFTHSMESEVQERAYAAHALLSSFDLVRKPIPELTMEPVSTAEEKSEELEKNKEVGNMTDDLLSLGIGDSSPSFTPEDKSATSNPLPKATHGSIASNARGAASALKYLLIPDQMKPVSGKAQRKKMQATTDHLQKMLENDTQLSFFSKLLNDEKSRQGSNTRSIESVSFTQQQPLRVALPMSAPVNTGNQPPSSFDNGFRHDAMGESNSVPTSFQNAMQENNANTTLNNHRSYDPFYLNSNGDGNNAGDKSNNKFGTIQLLDSDGDGNSNQEKKKKKKKAKAKKHNKQMGEADMAFLTGMGAQPLNNDTKRVTQSSIIGSEDEDDGDDEPTLVMNRRKNHRSNVKQIKGFESLAKVDLTTPLREDEVMPETTKHRVVPDRRAPADFENVETPRKKKKKAKKVKSSKKAKSSETQQSVEQVQTVPAPTENLLDFGGFDGNNFGNGTIETPSNTTNNNPINSAFDDLLSLEAPAAPILPTPAMQTMPTKDVTQEVSQNARGSSKAIRLWQTATLKASSNSSPFDWSRDVIVMYKMHSSKGNNLKVSLRIVNQTSNIEFRNVSIQFGGSKDILFDSISPGAQVEGGKIGPYPSSSSELKGTFEVSGASAQIKLTFPSSLRLSPLALQQDQVSEMLGSGQWSSYSAKIENRSEMEDSKLKLALMQFLTATEVDNGMMSDTNYMLASKSSDGNPVVMLVKTSKKGIKIDVKSNDKKLAKAVSSELKRIYI